MDGRAEKKCCEMTQVPCALCGELTDENGLCHNPGCEAYLPPQNPNANNPDALEADLDPEGDEPEGY
jgi:hypothetical protein